MTAQPLPALTSGDPSAWDQALYAFLVEKGNRSGLRRTRVSAARVASRVTVERCGEVARAKHRWASPKMLRHVKAETTGTGDLGFEP